MSNDYFNSTLNPNTIGVKNSLKVLEGLGVILAMSFFDLLIGQKLFIITNAWYQTWIFLLLNQFNYLIA